MEMSFWILCKDTERDNGERDSIDCRRAGVWQVDAALSFLYTLRSYKGSVYLDYIDQELHSIENAAAREVQICYTLLVQKGISRVVSLKYRLYGADRFGSLVEMVLSGTGGSDQITRRQVKCIRMDSLDSLRYLDVDGQENMETNVPIHGGFGTAFNAKTYDDTMKEFFEYMCNHYSEGCYNDAQVFSPFNDEMPEGIGSVIL